MLIQIYFFVLGASLGSFLTLCVARTILGQSIVSPRSHCDNCLHVLQPFDLIPIISYCLLNGRCRYCQKEFAPTSCLIELLMGILFLHNFQTASSNLGLISRLLIVISLIYLSLTDLKTTWVNGNVIGVLGIIGFICHPTFLNLIVLCLLAISLLTSFQLSSFIPGLGEADFELFFAFILLTHLQASVVILFVAAASCLISQLLFSHYRTKQIPFIPYLTFAYFLVTA